MDYLKPKHLNITVAYLFIAVTDSELFLGQEVNKASVREKHVLTSMVKKSGMMKIGISYKKSI